jgi:hypothetical protein
VKLLRIGDRIINLDLVTDIACSPMGDFVTVHLVSNGGSDDFNAIKFKGDEAASLWNYLCDGVHCTRLT